MERREGEKRWREEMERRDGEKRRREEMERRDGEKRRREGMEKREGEKRRREEKEKREGERRWREEKERGKKKTNGFGDVDDKENEMRRRRDEGREEIVDVTRGKAGESVVFVKRDQTCLKLSFFIIVKSWSDMNPRFHFSTLLFFFFSFISRLFFSLLFIHQRRGGRGRRETRET